MRTQTFGIEIETTGLGRQRTAEVIAKFFGTTAQYIGAHLDDWKVPMPDGRKWTVESDGSVTDLMNYLRISPPASEYYDGIETAYMELGFTDDIETVLMPALDRSWQRRKQISKR